MKKQLCRKVFLCTLFIVLATLIAIISHALLPAEVDVADFDSGLVKAIGFPAVATLYFLLLYTHCAVVMVRFSRRTELPKIKMGLSFGLSFGLLYFVGMQELQPNHIWDWAFVRYEFFMGLGDMIPVLLLCLAIAIFVIPSGEIRQPPVRPSFLITIVVTVVFFAVRCVGYFTKAIESPISEYPIQVIIWTIIFGITLGTSCRLLWPLFHEKKRLHLFLTTIGINWIIFNCFIALIYDGAWVQMLLRSGLDVIGLLISMCILNRQIGRMVTEP